MQLSEHFTLAEMTVSETAARQGLNNTPDADSTANLKRTCAMLEKVRALVGGPIVVTSGYRGPAVNAAVGGSKTSAHMTGRAADTNRPGLTPRQFAEKVKPKMKEFGIDQMILEFDSWVHLGIARVGETPRCQILTINNSTGGYVEGLC
jgi:hypothetical protein